MIMKLTTEHKTELKPILIRLAYFLIGAIIVFLYMRNCEGKTVVVAKTPVLTGTLKNDDSVKNTPEPFTQTNPKPIVMWDSIEVKVENTINMEIFNKYISSKDSISKLNVLLKAITINDFEKTIENDTIKLRMFGKSIGTVTELSADYEIKPISVPIKVPKQTRWGIGVFGGVSIEGKPTIGAGLSYDLIKL